VEDDLKTNPTLFLRLGSPQSAPRAWAWNEFYARYAPVIAGFARKMGARPSEVDDLVQEVLLGFFKAQPTFEYDPARGRFRGYLKTVTWRTWIKARRKTRDSAPLEGIDPEAPSIEEAWADAWKKAQLAHAIESVREQYHDNSTFRSWQLATVDKMPTEAVAAALGLSRDAVYKNCQRINQALRQHLSALEESEG
jgi:RNA polymerase sigma factor (sigma-70 family)